MRLGGAEEDAVGTIGNSIEPNDCKTGKIAWELLDLWFAKGCLA
jgi:hypothetical protein